ncbi:MAG: V-type ATP synthase subunit D [Chlamydiales bacterium]|nr:V-type ATP synthase subunit D [Chlamydiales bacterium]
MVGIRFTKNELRDQQVKLAQLQKYLPTLQLKKAMLQVQASEVRAEIVLLMQPFDEARKEINAFSFLLLKDLGIEPKELVKSSGIKKSYENIAGVEIPRYEGMDFEKATYSLFEAPAWLDAIVAKLRAMMELEAKILIAEEKKAAIEKELREVAIRVNLFEKVMIPKALENIKVIKVFLGDQQLAAVARAKVAKTKIEARRKKALAGEIP